ncbi:hypothetical protein ACFVWT_08610 [Arthrobacter sp. NPDC058288]|uniref:hypothetical protein n=1 Tax=Arthrobacter sp. NPDC058288 TaxID=3346424 RepID=UPI0036E866FA
MYDPFVASALEPWSFGMYAGGQSIRVGTPSGVTLAPEGGAQQSITTPSIGLEQPECTAWEPAFAQDLEWCMLETMSPIGIPGGRSAYFRLTTRPLDQAHAAMPTDAVLLERRRRHAVAGGYRLTDHDPVEDRVTLVGVGAMMPKVIASAARLKALGIMAGVVCLTSPDLVFESLQRRNSLNAATGSSGPDIIDALLPRHAPAPLVTVQDGPPTPCPSWPVPEATAQSPWE